MTIEKPSNAANAILEILTEPTYVSHQVELILDEFTYDNIQTVQVKISQWIHDKHGFRSLDALGKISKSTGFFIGGVVSEADNEIEIRFFKYPPSHPNY